MPTSDVYASYNPGFSINLDTVVGASTGAILKIAQGGTPATSNSRAVGSLAAASTTTVAGDYVAGSTYLAGISGVVATMTTGDVLACDTTVNGHMIKITKGANDTFLGVNGSGVLGFYAAGGGTPWYQVANPTSGGSNVDMGTANWMINSRGYGVSPFSATPFTPASGAGAVIWCDNSSATDPRLRFATNAGSGYRIAFATNDVPTTAQAALITQDTSGKPVWTNLPSVGYMRTTISSPQLNQVPYVSSTTGGYPSFSLRTPPPDAAVAVMGAVGAVAGPYVAFPALYIENPGGGVITTTTRVVAQGVTLFNTTDPDTPLYSGTVGSLLVCMCPLGLDPDYPNPGFYIVSQDVTDAGKSFSWKIEAFS